MSHLVAICDACHLAALLPVAEFRAESQRCSRCQCALRAVPSRTFGSSERELFAELAEAVRSASLSSADALALGSRIARALTSEDHTEIWERLTSRVPGLLARQLVLGNNVRAHQSTLAALRVILDAVATTRGSGERAAIKLPRAGTGDA
ncbi:MAG TPA: hypothetical protein VHM25_21470 [Polyangiaceae bacterium]|nr:hypothetical protein [Polyangiaceae bacterium]